MFILASNAICSDVTSFLGIGFVPNDPGVTAAIIPITWKVLFPSRVPELWSTLSATYCKKLSSAKLGMSFPFSAAAQHSNFDVAELQALIVEVP